ncbi:MAG: hypothetical protein ACK6A9_08285 [Dolichospermum sp.]|nr:hypothetical protein [Anabaena sp. 49628_E55]
MHQLNENANRLANTILSQREEKPEVINLLLEKVQISFIGFSAKQIKICLHKAQNLE